MKQTIADSAHA